MILNRSICCRLLQRTIARTPQKRYNSFQYCSKLVQTRDYQNYLSVVLLPGELRDIGFVTHAFNIELAQIQEQTTDVHLAQGRLDFWQKGLDDTFRGYPPNHPVLVNIALCLEKQFVSKQWFDRLLSIRKQYLNEVPFMTLDDVEEYGEYAVSSIFYVLLEFIQAEDESTKYAASHLGNASSLVTLLRSVPHFIQKRKVFLPTELCFHHSVSHEDIIRNKNYERVREVIYDTASQAYLHLEHMKKLLPDVPHEYRTIFLPSVPCDLFLENLRQIDFNVYDSKFNQKQWLLPFKLLMERLRYRFSYKS